MSRVLPRLFLLLLLAFPAAAQPPAHVGLDLSNPARAYTSFLAEAERVEQLFLAYRAAPSMSGQYNLARATVRLGLNTFDLQDVPLAARPRMGTMAAAMLADILVRVPPPPEQELAALAANPDPPSRWTIPGTDIRLVRIDDGPRTGDYVVSASSVARLAEFHERVIGLPPLREVAVPNWSEAQAHFVGPLLAHLPLDRMPRWLHHRIFDTPAWKTLSVLVVIILGTLAYRGWSRIVARLAAPRRGWRQRLALLGRPLGLAVIAFGFYAMLVLQTAPGGAVAEAVDLANGAVLVLAAAWAAWHLCWLVAEVAIASPSLPNETYDANLLRLLARVASVLAAGLIGVYGASLLGVPALGLLAGVSIGGIALALAAQNTVENLLGGFIIFTDRPFRVGDVIRHGALSGTVEAVGPRSSRIRAADGSLTAVPNAELAKVQLTNLSARDRWIVQHRMPLPPDLPAAQVARRTTLLRERILAHPALVGAPAPPRIALVPMEEGELGIEMSVPLACRSAEAFMAAQEALILEALRALEESGDAA